MTINSPDTATTPSVATSISSAEELIPALTSLTDDVGALRTVTRFTHEDVTDLHGRTLMAEWGIRGAARGKAAPADLLEEIADMGFAWRDVARMVGVSVPAIQKWRRGSGVTGPNRAKIASLLAAADMITSRCGVKEIASWFEMPLPGSPVTPIDLYAEDQARLLFDYANGADPEEILNEYNPSWRKQYHSDFEIFENGDGELAIRPKDQ